MHRGLLIMLLFLAACGREPIPRDLYDASVVPHTPQAIQPVAVTAPTTVPAPDAPLAVPTQVSAVPVGKVGDRLESAGIALVINSVERVTSLGEFQDADPGREYLILDVSLENTDRDEADYSPVYFKVKDTEGYEYNATYNSADTSLKSGTLLRGEQVRGKVAIDIPRGLGGLVASFEPSVLFGGYQVIRVNLF